MYVIYQGPRPRVGMEVHLVGLSLTFTHHVIVKTGQLVLAARLPDGVDCQPSIRQATVHPNFAIMQLGIEAVADHRARADAIESDLPVPSDLASPVQMAIDLACNVGWTAEDLDGTGQGDDPGDAGGRSPVTGLTLAEMALSRPPADWDENRDTGYPWASADWHPPAPGWTPPNPPDKQPPADDETESSSGGEPLDQLDLLGEDSGAGDDSESPDSESTVAASSEAPDDSESGDSDESPDSGAEEAVAAAEASANGVDPAIEAGYPAEHVDVTRRITHQVADARGKTPHPNAVNFILDKKDLPHVNTAQVAGLLARPAPPPEGGP